MSKPTEQQVKEFWEWCGLRYGGYGNLYRWRAGSLPSIDLNNLFKYAVPVAIKDLAQRILPGTDEATRELEALRILLASWLEKIKQGLVYEEALFWVLWQVKHS